MPFDFLTDFWERFPFVVGKKERVERKGQR